MLMMEGKQGEILICMVFQEQLRSDLLSSMPGRAQHCSPARAVLRVLAGPTILAGSHSAPAAPNIRSRRGCKVSTGLDEIFPPDCLTKPSLQELSCICRCVCSPECLRLPGGLTSGPGEPRAEQRGGGEMSFMRLGRITRASHSPAPARPGKPWALPRRGGPALGSAEQNSSIP